MDTEAFARMSEHDSSEFLETVVHHLDGRFSTSSEDRTIFTHTELEIPFRLVLPGTFVMGLSDVEKLKRVWLDQYEGDVEWEDVEDEFPEEEIYSLLPALTMSMETPLLVSELPITASQMTALGCPVVIDDDLGSYPAQVGFAEATRFCERFGCRLPTEVEWEYFCKAHTDTLFLWGEDVPEVERLQPWISLDCANTSDMRANIFGLKCLFGLEWCQDAYKTSHDPNAVTRPGFRVAKGGGALFQPWQVSEWLWCLPAWRHGISSTLTRRDWENDSDQLLPGIRPVFNLENIL